MSNKMHVNNCQHFLSGLTEDLDNFYRDLIQKSEHLHQTIELSLQIQQLALLAAHFPADKSRKIVITDSHRKAKSALDKFLPAWDSTLSVNHHWHLIANQLAPPEIDGLVITNNSHSMHALLSSKKRHHFIVSADILDQPIPDPKIYQSSFLTLTAREPRPLSQLTKDLAAQGYTRYQTAQEPGSFAVHGENIDIKPPYHQPNLTITFHHDVIEQIVTHTTPSHPVNQVALPPLGFPPLNFSWSDLITRSILFRPSHLNQYRGQLTIITDAVTEFLAFPFTVTTAATATQRNQSLNIFYQHHHRVTSWLREKNLSARTLCPSPVAQLPVTLQRNNQLWLSEAAILPTPTPTRPISYAQGLTLLQQLKPGRPAVHSDHGIGYFEGLQTRTVNEQSRDYLVLRYAGSDTLSVPVEYAHKVTAYTGPDHPTINKLGGATWSKIKRQAQANAEQLAQSLLRTDQLRSNARRPPLLANSQLNQQIEQHFPHTLTADQASAWADVQADFAKDVPMDRLIVGDVGFGKTEIAVRAAFVAVANHKQVAILAPTTLLVQQHFDTFQTRLPELADRIGQLSRFATPQQQAAVRQKIAAGDLSIIIGTHALLSPKTIWPDLGLVVIDEEQRFGVKHKEHFKQLRSSIDLLSLSATPIPRTLHMALSGLRGLSVINTAPIDRQSGTVAINPDSDQVIQAAISLELGRGGQVYVVAPRVSKLSALAHRINKLLPRATTALAHGQLDDKALAHVMHQFDDGLIDVLISSTIIASGLDLPRANTIIIIDSPHFGLADLYQLKGRVGRRQVVGHTHLLYNQSQLSPVQRKRLAAITQSAPLGSGWKLAQRDLELRGAGNLLGAEQSGSIESVGLSLYLDLVKQAVAKESGQAEPLPDIEVQLPITASLPPDYVPDIAERTDWYQRLTRCQLEQLKPVTAELVNTYGPLPPSTQHLLGLLRLQRTAAQHHITKISSHVVTPPGLEPDTYLTVQTSNPSGTLAKLKPLGHWREDDNVLTLPVPAITPDLVNQLNNALK